MAQRVTVALRDDLDGGPADKTLRGDHLAGALALLGTTLTSYVYMWETILRAWRSQVAMTRGGGRLAGPGPVPSQARCSPR